MEVEVKGEGVGSSVKGEFLCPSESEGKLDDLPNGIYIQTSRRYR